MAEVYWAEHETLDEARVYKLLLPQFDEGMVERFKAEARAAAALKHRNIMRARDFGRCGDSMFIEMDAYEGETLASLLDQAGGPLQPSRMIAILAGVASGIEAAHKKASFDYWRHAASYCSTSDMIHAERVLATLVSPPRALDAPGLTGTSHPGWASSSRKPSSRSISCIPIEMMIF
jgi:serine/threonine protein kinase